MKEISKRFEHFTEVRLGVEKPSAMPPATLNALNKIMGSPIGAKIRDSSRTDKIRLVLVSNIASAFEAFEEDNSIYYTTNVQAWLKTLKHNRVPGDLLNASTVDLAVLLVHEIGHTGFGKSLVCCAPTNPREEEIWVSRHFENTYRKHVGRQLKRSYWRQNDVVAN